MCGIAGFATRPGKSPWDMKTLSAMTDVLTHRGPDDQGFLLDGGVGLGHRRLSIIDVAGGQNPLEDRGGHVALIFNGEIYNHMSLRKELTDSGCRPATGSDGEVIVHGYLTWGLEETLRRIRGMFAFALLDRRDHSLHLARDPFGIKPLFIKEDAEGVLFGSELKSLVAALGVRPDLSSTGLLQVASMGFTLSPSTIFAGCESLDPGTWLSVRDGKVSRGRFHAVQFEPGRESSDPQALWEALGRSVSRHLMSEVPLGSFLSGGIDSSAIVAAMSEQASGPVEAVCVGISEDGMDERPYAREVASSLGVTLHEETAVPALLDLLPRLAWHLESPFSDTSAAPSWLVCQGARRHVTVALSGDGGDENFAGYRRTRFDVLEAQWRGRLPALIRHGILGPLGRQWPSGPWMPKPLRAATFLRNLGSDWLDAYIFSMSRIPEEEVRHLFHPEVLSPEPLREAFEPAAAKVADLDPLHRVLAMDMATWLKDDILVKVDRMSMAHSLEVRVPLLDTDFVHYVGGLPVEAKLHGGSGKTLFRQSLRGKLSDSVLDRPKQGFHLPMSRWLRGGLRDQLQSILSEENGPSFDWVQHHRFQRLADEHFAERADRSRELWFLMTLDAFLRSGPGGSEVAMPSSSRTTEKRGRP